MKIKLKTHTNLPVCAQHGGMFVSRGVGRHPKRIIDTFEIIYIDSGKLGMAEEKQRFSIYPGESLLLQPGREHRGTEPYPPDLRFYWIHFKLKPDRAASSSAAMTLEQQKQIRRPECMVELLRTFLRNQEEDISDSATQDCILYLLLKEMLLPHQTSDPGKASYLAEQAGIIIKTRFHENISTMEIAKELECNPDYLGRIFKKHHEKTITQAIHQRQTAQASEFLLNSNMNVNQISSHCGFSDAGHFRRIFKQQTGLSPREYRASHSKIHVNTL